MEVRRMRAGERARLRELRLAVVKDEWQSELVYAALRASRGA